MGLVIGREGFPRADEIFEDNTQDGNTRRDARPAGGARGPSRGLNGRRRRGMAFADNIANCDAASSLCRGRWTEKARPPACRIRDGRWVRRSIRQPAPRNPSQKKSSVRVKAHPLNNETLILCISHERVEKDRAIREKHEGRFLKDLARVQARIQNGRLKNDVKIGEAIGRLKERYPRVARYHSLTFDAKTRQLKNEPDEEKREMAASLDGSYLLRTDRQDLSAEEAWRIYASLTRARTPSVA